MAGSGQGAGRPGALAEARELIALVASLSEAGDALTEEAVSARLGVSPERARRLIELVLTAAGAGGARLPLVEEADGVTLAFSQGVHGRRLRLTRGETVALAAALERLGVPGDDPLRQRLEDSSSSEPVSPDLVERLLGGRSDEAAEALEACADALARRSALTFSYRKGERPGEPERRLVSPLRLSLEEGTWYLVAHDLVRGAERTFRLDRMSDLEPARASAPAAEAPEAPRRTVRLVFTDRRFLDLLPWHDLVPAGDDPETGGAAYVTPHYGGEWLARMVAACGGTCTTDDPELRAEVERYVAGELGRA